MRNKDGYIQHRRMWDLAWRMLMHGARTRTVSQWSGISERRVRALVQRYTSPSDGDVKRPRGKSPYRVEALLRSPVLRTEGAVFAQTCSAASYLNLHSDSGRELHLPDIAGGEKLCTAYEAFKMQFPSSSLTIEQALLVLTALARADELALTQCPQCSAPMLLDRLSTRHHRCHRCSSRVSPLATGGLTNTPSRQEPNIVKARLGH